MDVETSTYGSLLIPILKERLPDELVFLISRRFENCSSILSKGSSSSSSSNGKSTTWNFLGLSEVGEGCVFCSKDHASVEVRGASSLKILGLD